MEIPGAGSWLCPDTAREGRVWSSKSSSSLGQEGGELLPHDLAGAKKVDTSRQRKPSLFEDVHSSLEKWETSSSTVCVHVMSIETRLSSELLSCVVSEDSHGSPVV